ncbi:hypothetical protein C8J56DRAFT_936587 [Mycena floridula]|nr:hypothetical protein C8J56DRAFT_936587 [Mycena floridula]
MNSIASYLKSSVLGILSGKPHLPDADSDSSATISPSNSTFSTSASDPSESRGPKSMFDVITDRAIKPERACFPDGWSNDWGHWVYGLELNPVFDRSNLQIWLEEKYHLSFQKVRLLMFEIDTEKLVFQYCDRFYRYQMEDADLFIYPTSDRTDADGFLENWNGIDGSEQSVEAKGTDQGCLAIHSDQFFKDHARGCRERSYLLV